MLLRIKMKKSTVFSIGYLLLLGVVTILFGAILRNGNWLQTDLHVLLPDDQQWSLLQKQADQKQEQQMNRQIVALIGSESQTQSQQIIEKIAKQWQTSGLFSSIIYQIQPDIEQLRSELNLLKVATLPQKVRNQLLEEPKRYFQEYAEQIVNPFEQNNLLPLEQDWLGFGRFTLSTAQQQSKMQWEANSGLIYIQDNNLTWGLMRGELKTGNLINPDQSLATLMLDSEHIAQNEKTEFLVTGSALFATHAKQQAEKEGILMSSLGISLTLLLLLIVFRTLKVLWLFLPIVTGMFTGIVATVFLFGQIHILTLVIGTSLIGVLIDFPLHWLSGSIFNAKWQAQQAMRHLRFTFLISLFVTLLGYGLLGFTALSVLKQTALFSATALVSAWLTTLLFLPILFTHYQAKEHRLPAWLQINFPAKLQAKEKLWIIIGVMFISLGVSKSQWQDDIRQWISMPEAMLLDAKQIGDLTGIDLGNQYLLITADNENALLTKNKMLTEKLQKMGEKQPLVEFQSLSDWIMSEDEQRQFIEQLRVNIQPADYQILQELGIPEEMIKAEIERLTTLPPLKLEQALKTTLGQAWETLYLGKLDNQVASIVKVKNVNIAEMEQLASTMPGIYWQDKREHLNQLFQATRNQTAWLKLLSFGLAGLLLWRYFGLRQTAQMLVIPLCAIIITIGLFGWLGLPISLFTMFGLLLVSAIGIDYTAYMQTAKEPTVYKRIAISLAAMTTLISFLLLGLSSTPAVASFGLSVSVGVVVSIALSVRFLK